MASTIRDRNGGTSSSSAAVDRNTGLATSAAVKAPVRSLSTTPITLSGLQTIAGVALVAGDRHAAAGQADGTLNGVYTVSTGNWPRTPDFSRNDDVFAGTLIVVSEGTNLGIWGVTCATSPAVIGTTAIAISPFPAIAGYALLASPAFTGNPTAPTQLAANNSTRLATTAFVKAAIDVVLGGVSTAFDTLSEIAAAVSAKWDATVVHALSSKGTPVDADEVAGYDSVGSVGVRFTFTNMWANYFKGKADAAYAATRTTVSQAEAEAGTSTTVRDWTAQRVKQAIAATGAGVYVNPPPVGAIVVLYVNNGGNYGNGGSVAGLTCNPGGGVMPGTWTNVSQATIVNGSSGFFMRSA